LQKGIDSRGEAQKAKRPAWCAGLIISRNRDIAVSNAGRTAWAKPLDMTRDRTGHVDVYPGRV
jgi:hypothetical protein